MRRFFTEPENINNGTAVLYEDAGHITKVLRMQAGEQILIFDGSGFEYTAVLTEIDKTCCKAQILDKTYSELEPQIKVTVFQGIPKAGKMEQIIQKAVELGVYRIIPVSMERCVSKIEKDKKGTEKIRRWNKVAVEAAKQCGRGMIPVVAFPVDFMEAVGMLKEEQFTFFPYEMLGHAGERNLKEQLQEKREVQSIGFMVGPEGGFSDAEASYAKEAGIIPVGLGKRILRTETVASTLLSILIYEKNEI